jgi:hypothetical protein
MRLSFEFGKAERGCSIGGKLLDLTTRLRSETVLEGLWRVILQVVDRVDYAATSVRLLIFDRLNGPEPLTEADREREARVELVRREGSLF